MEDPEKSKLADEIKMRNLRHDIRNQLSNINLALEQLKYEIPDDVGSDSAFYLDTISMSCTKINELLSETN